MTGRLLFSTNISYLCLDKTYISVLCGRLNNEITSFDYLVLHCLTNVCQFAMATIFQPM